uniref:Stealth protein CR1 conserved region 1 domain-containing protein n=1 Tax=Timema monikensis TaxID=170555 RepID=A0A7R9E8Q1_9NEOP|nr:unnamed protein product [Timema monikensis]
MIPTMCAHAADSNIETVAPKTSAKHICISKQQEFLYVCIIQAVLLNKEFQVMAMKCLDMIQCWMLWNKEKYNSLSSPYSDNILTKSLQHQLCQKVPIDVVYTWVNGSDPILIKQIAKYRDAFYEELSKQCPYTNCVPSHVVSLRFAVEIQSLGDIDFRASISRVQWMVVGKGDGGENIGGFWGGQGVKLGLLKMLERSVDVRGSGGCSRDRRRWVHGWSIVSLSSSLGSSVGGPCRRGGCIPSRELTIRRVDEGWRVIGQSPGNTKSRWEVRICPGNMESRWEVGDSCGRIGSDEMLLPTNKDDLICSFHNGGSPGLGHH